MFNSNFGLNCLPSASCFACPNPSDLNNSEHDQKTSSQALVDHINSHILLPAIEDNDDNSVIMTETAEAPPLAACDSSLSALSRQESTTSSKESDDTVPIQDCISKDHNNDDGGDEEIPPMPQRSSLARLISGCSVGSTEERHCPICLDPMQPFDHQHPLQCPTRHCHFNFCASCVHSLLSSSKDDFEMASDGNAHVKIYLHCPNCRADLSTTIRDVLLLRKVDTVQWLLARGAELNPSQQRTRLAMQELHIQQAIQQARDKEVIFWKTHHRELYGDEDDNEDTEDDTNVSEHKEDSGLSRRGLSRYESSRRLRDGSFSYEEWGVEADLDTGVHSSFRMPAGSAMIRQDSDQHNNSPNPKKQPPAIDETLLQGLEGLMLHAEQLNVTHWMTSGDPDLLAQAAQTLRQIEQDARQGIKPADRQKLMNRRASVYEIVEETRQLQLEETPHKPQSAPSVLSPAGDYYARRMMTPRQRQTMQRQQRAAEHMKAEMALAVKAALLERCPLPVRMPKAIVLELGSTERRFPLKFANDHWDGTILDAYTKLSVTARRSSQQPFAVTKKTQSQHPGVFYVLSQGQYQRHYGRVELTMDQPRRVLIASVQGPAGRQGVMKGDVVTHVDGEAFTNQSVDNLLALLRSKRETGQTSVSMVLNAEVSIAEALKRRSQVLDE